MPIYEIHCEYIKEKGKLRKGMTGHRIEANNPEDAMRIANKYRIANPIGAEDVKERSFRLNEKTNKPYVYTREEAKNCYGSVWYEENKELKSKWTKLRPNQNKKVK